ncbi:S66 family peptidase [Tenacibaculum sp. C7A-26P2]|uniref:S66 family peptidase n=1 Tax=Tenacibaculum sp. C7A-26P2 TaxID=3447504 RepID=UPI003F878CDE
MIKPKKLKRGDKVATISLSWGGAGDIPKRYAEGKKQLENIFGLKVVETTNALKPSEWIYENPQARALDLMEALEDKSIKAIISNIGGEDSIRTLPFIDLELIRSNPKIFLGFSDSTVTHFCFYKAGVTSFYGTSTLVGFAENGGMHQYQVSDIKRTLFSSKKIYEIKPNLNGWTSERLEWKDDKNQFIKRKLEKSKGWRFLQGTGKVKGVLLGGCLEVMEFMKDTDFWVKPADWKEKIMFIETSEAKMTPVNFKWIMRNYAASGILKNIKGLIMARPYDDLYWKDYDAILLQVIHDEEGLIDLPIITGMDFGHTCPTFTIPIGVKAEIDSDKQVFSILESGVV